jgi:hypothetical protein
MLPLLEFYRELRSGRSVTTEVDHWLMRLGLADWGSRKGAKPSARG